jgi:hypothetical protein
VDRQVTEFRDVKLPLKSEAAYCASVKGILVSGEWDRTPRPRGLATVRGNPLPKLTASGLWATSGISLSGREWREDRSDDGTTGERGQCANNEGNTMLSRCHRGRTSVCAGIRRGVDHTAHLVSRFDLLVTS